MFAIYKLVVGNADVDIVEFYIRFIGLRIRMRKK